MITNPTVWTIDKLFDCAAACRTYSQFYTRFPLAYQSAKEQGMLGVIQAHCGWEKQGHHVTDAYVESPMDLHDLMTEDWRLFHEAVNDPMWPLELNEIPIDEELSLL